MTKILQEEIWELSDDLSESIERRGQSSLFASRALGVIIMCVERGKLADGRRR